MKKAVALALTLTAASVALAEQIDRPDTRAAELGPMAVLLGPSRAQAGAVVPSLADFLDLLGKRTSILSCPANIGGRRKVTNSNGPVPLGPLRSLPHRHIPAGEPWEVNSGKGRITLP